VDYKDWDPEDESAVGESESPRCQSLVVYPAGDAEPPFIYVCAHGILVANVQGRLTADLVSALAYGRDKTKGERVLP
jgi:hypothetical protein